MATEIITKLSQYICGQVLKRPDFPLGNDDPLITSGLIDSFHLVDLAIFIEDNFGVKISDTELNADNFDTLNQLVSLINKRQGS